MIVLSRHRDPRSIISAFCFSLPDRQLQLFQPFHLWHSLTGFSFAVFFTRFHKAASSARALSDSAFFILFTSLSSTDSNIVRSIAFVSLLSRTAAYEEGRNDPVLPVTKYRVNAGLHSQALCDCRIMISYAANYNCNMMFSRSKSRNPTFFIDFQHVFAYFVNSSYRV